MFPLGHEVGASQPVGKQMQVEVRHARRDEKDPRPRGLLLDEQDGEWLIVGSTSW